MLHPFNPKPEPETQRVRFDLAGLVTVTMLYGAVVFISPDLLTALICLVVGLVVLSWSGAFVEAFAQRESVDERISIHIFVFFALAAVPGVPFFGIRLCNSIFGPASLDKFLDVFLLLICIALVSTLILLEKARATKTNTRFILGIGERAERTFVIGLILFLFAVVVLGLFLFTGVRH